MNWIILFLAGLCEVGFTYCLGRAKGEKYTTYFRSVIAFGHVSIIEDADEKLATARLLGNRYNPHQDEALQKEIDKGLHRMVMIRMKIEHLTGKEAIELARKKDKSL